MVALYWFALVSVCREPRTPDLAKGDRHNFLEQLLDWRSLVGLLLYAAAAMLVMCALPRISLSVAGTGIPIAYLGRR